MAEATGTAISTQSEEFARLPLHLKDIGELDLAAMDRLTTATAGAADRWAYVKAFVTDGEMFAKVEPEAPVPVAKLVPGDLAKMQTQGRIEELGPADKVRGTVHIFTRAEHLGTAKARRRGITWTKIANDVVGRETLTIDTHVPKWRLRAVVAPGTVAYCIDFSEWFGHFVLDPTVREFMCFRADGGKLWRTTRLSMGQTQSSMIASVGTLRICDVPLPDGVAVHVATDNIRVTGPPRGARDVIAAVIQRAQQVGATINEDTTDLDDLVATSYDFLGEHYDHEAGTMCATAKLVKKLTTTTDALLAALDAGTCTHQLLSVHLGVLFYVSSTLRVCIYEHHQTMRFMRARAVAVQEDPSLWRLPLPKVPAGVLNDLRAWTAHALANRPVPIATPPGRATHVFMSDASGWGWSCVAWDVCSGTVTLHQKAWGDSFHDGDDSTKAEPEGIYRSLCAHLTKESAANARVIFYTDHNGYTFAQNAGYGKSYAYDAVIRRTCRSFPTLRLETRHVRGIKNLVDGWSRGSDATFDEVKVMDGLKEIAQDMELRLPTGAFANPLPAVVGSD